MSDGRYDALVIRAIRRNGQKSSSHVEERKAVQCARIRAGPIAPCAEKWDRSGGDGPVMALREIGPLRSLGCSITPFAYPVEGTHRPLHEEGVMTKTDAGGR